MLVFFVMATVSSTAPTPRAADLSYTACYCEENVYMLCKKLAQSGIAACDASDLLVVFISNTNKQIPIWCQKAGSSTEGGLVIWDYHVILIQSKNGAEAIVWDLDATLQFPETFSHYVTMAFRPSFSLSPDFQRLYRVVAGGPFLKYFASDRRHMKTAEGLWKRPPPPYDCICADDGVVHNLEDYLDMSKVIVERKGTSYEELICLERFGAVLNEGSLQDFFAGRSVNERIL
ncbi:hypothetical protein GOP47_0017756 [Adiantum capillus-veneris]|uniref:Protein N-terminal glutamine amidohydrolase n=1 Tax=Adiantum capillus-veneris TaxID=13818 RepID=A0A9D4UFZ1_ADICA|nr:hypothetical protein GOP47_0017756 [Adiantum capillus-veneris]